MKVDLDEQLKQLPGMDRAALRLLWKDLFGQLPHKKLRRELLVPILAYRLQEKVLGGLKPSIARWLRALAEEIRSGKSPGDVIPIQPRAGTRMVREWQGQLHEVTVTAGGFDYKNQRYKSLSEIAREITGTRWSGPAFFGLKKRGSKKAA
jgi:hypothetical protein